MNNRTPINEHLSSPRASHRHRQNYNNPYNDRCGVDAQNIQRQYIILKQKVEGKIKQLQSRCGGTASRLDNNDSNRTRITINSSTAHNGNNINSSNVNNAENESEASQTKINMQPIHNCCNAAVSLHNLNNDNNNSKQCKYCSIQEEYAQLKKQQQQERESDGRTERHTYASTHHHPRNNNNNNNNNNGYQEYEFNRYHNNSVTRNMHSPSISSQNSANTNNGYLAPATAISSQYESRFNHQLTSSAVNKTIDSKDKVITNVNNIVIQQHDELNNNNIENVKGNDMRNNEQGSRKYTLPIYSKGQDPLITPQSPTFVAHNCKIPRCQNTASITGAISNTLPLQLQLQANNINAISLNQALLSNMMLQREMSNNLKVLNERLSDLSVKRSDSSQFIDDNRSRAQSRDGQFYKSHGKVRTNQELNYMGHYHQQHNFDCKCKQCIRYNHQGISNYDGQQYREHRNNSHRSKSTTKRYATQSVQYPQPNQYKNHRRAHQYENYVTNNHNCNDEQDDRNIGINVNRIETNDRNRRPYESVGHKYKSSTQHFDRQRIDSYDRDDKNTESGRAKSVSARSSSSKNSHRQLGVIRVIKDNTNSKLTKKQYDRNRGSNSSKKLDSQYFIRKRSPHHHHHNHHSNKLRTDISNTKYMPVDPTVYQHYCPLHTTNQVMEMYERRAKTKNNQIYKDSEYRNMKHQKQHIMKAFQQQERARKQLLSKISKNFFTTYGVK